MPTAADPAAIVRPVASASELTAFVELPYRLYAGDPNFVPPLRRDVRMRLSPKHPYFEHAEAQLFVAWRGARAVGRIAATVNRLHNDTHHDRVGFFGFFETEADRRTAGALIHAAKTWLVDRGMDTVRGPASFSTNDECGLLVSGFDGPPALMMPYNPPHYADILEAAGFRKAMDLWAWTMLEADTDLARWKRICEKIRAREGATSRPLDMRNFARDLEIIRDLYQDAWAPNWGFVPMTAAEFTLMGKEMKPVVIPDLCQFVIKDGREVGFGLAIPDLNQILIKLGGRLFPFGLFRILAGKGRINAMRLLTLGVRREFQNRGYESLLYDSISTHCINRGITTGEASWILETNDQMNHAMARAGGRVYRTYRMYDAKL